MIGVDTNVLVRFFVQDDTGQAEIAQKFLSQRTASDPAFLSAVVVVELVWALKENYDCDRHQIHAVLALLANSANVSIEREDLIKAAIASAQAANADIADSIIAVLARDAGCAATMTFDKIAAKRIAGMELLA
ncbi:MAG: type II toxin-antitoxin system VapC family toxin [Devosia sp.]